MIGVQLHGHAGSARRGGGAAHLPEGDRGAEAALRARVDGAVAAHPGQHDQPIAPDGQERRRGGAVLRREPRHAQEGVAGEREEGGRDARSDRDPRSAAGVDRPPELGPAERCQHHERPPDPGVAARRCARARALPVAHHHALALAGERETGQGGHREPRAEGGRRVDEGTRDLEVGAAALERHPQRRGEPGRDRRRDADGREALSCLRPLLRHQQALGRARLGDGLEHQPGRRARPHPLAAGRVAAALRSLLELDPDGPAHHAVAIVELCRAHLTRPAHHPDPQRRARRRAIPGSRRAPLARDAHHDPAVLRHGVQRAAGPAWIGEEVDHGIGLRAPQGGDRIGSGSDSHGPVVCRASRAV